jgi:hypothetical protein
MALRAESVEAPLERRWDVMGPEEAWRLHEKRLAEHRRFARWSPRTRRRLLRHGLGTAVAWTVAGTIALTDFRWIVPATGLLMGLAVALVRMPDLAVPVLYGAAGFAMLALALGREMGTLGGVWRFAFGSFFFVMLGVLVAKDEEFRRLDGED